MLQSRRVRDIRKFMRSLGEEFAGSDYRLRRFRTETPPKWNPPVKKLDKRLSRTRRLIMKFNYVRERTEDTRLDYGAISNSSRSTSVL